MTVDIARRGAKRAYGADANEAKIRSLTIVTSQGTLYMPRKK